MIGMGEGEIIPVESVATLAGSLGDVSFLSRRRVGVLTWVWVLKESAELALSRVKTHAYDLDITNQRAQDPLRIPMLP